jgi:uncharacterized protein YdcH (DUF465 family)
MVNKHVGNLVARFPDMPEAIHRILESNPALDALCKSYGEVMEQLHEREGGRNPRDMARDEELKKRRAALEAEIIAIMEQNARV